MNISFSKLKEGETAMDKGMTILKDQTARIYILLIILIIAIHISFTSTLAQSQNSSTNQTVSEKQYKPKLIVQTGHSEQITSVVYSPNGKYIASGGGTEIKLWDVEKAKELKTFRGHISYIESVIFSPNGKLLASVDAGSQSDGTALVKIWNVTSGKVIKTIELDYSPITSNAIAFSPDGKYLAISSGSDVSVFSVAENKIIKEFTELEDSFSSIAFSPDGKHLIGGTETAIVFLDISTGKEIKKWTVVDEDTESYGIMLKVSSDGKFLVGRITEKLIKVWNLESGKEIRTLTDKVFEFQSFAISGNGKLLAITLIDIESEEKGKGTEQYLKLLNIETGQEIKKVKNQFSKIVFNPENNKLAGSESDTKIAIWDVSTGRRVQRFESSISETPWIKFSLDGNKIIGYGGADGAVNIWNLENGLSYKKLDGHITKDGTTTYVSKIILSPNGKHIATEAQYAPIKIWDISTGKLIQTINVASWVTSKVFSSDGRYLYTFENAPDEQKDSGYAVWDISNGKKVKTIKSNLVSIESILISPDGKDLVGIGTKDSDSDDNFYIEFIDIESGTILRELSAEKAQKHIESVSTKSISKAVFSPNGKILATFISFTTSGVPGTTGTTSYVALWNVETGEIIRFIENPNPDAETVLDVSFSSDSKRIATIDHLKTVRIIDVQTGQNVKFTQIPEWVKLDADDVEISNLDGKKIQAVSDNGRIILSDAISKKKLGSLISINKNDWAIVTPEGLFDATDNAQKLMYFVVSDEQIGYEFIELEQLKSNYYVPNLFKKLLTGEKLSKVENLTITLSPDVDVKYSKIDLSALSLKLKNRGGGIGRVEIRVNGSELTSNALTGKSVNPNSAEYNLPIKIPPKLLRVGRNSVEIITWNKADYVRSKKNEIPIYKDSSGKVRGVETFKIPDKEKKSKIPKFYAIVAGVSDYVGDSLDLRYAAKDAEDMSLALSLGARKLFCSKEISQNKACDKVNIKLLSTEQNTINKLVGIKNFQKLSPTKDNFRKAFAEVSSQANPEDVVLIYLAGHGNAIKSPEATEQSAFPDLYLYATSEATSIQTKDLRNKSVRDATTLSSLELADWMKNIKADKKALILDTCAAGAVQGTIENLSSQRDEGAEKIRALDRLRERTGFYVLMGSAADAVSYEASNYRQGLLTYSLLEAMTINSKLRNGKFIDIQSWFANSVDRVEVLAEGIGGIQKPRLFASNFAKSFDVGELSQDEQSKIPLAQPVPIILEPELREMGRRIDSAKLSEKLTKKLREISYTTKRGESIAINYVDAKDAINGLSPRGEYKFEGDSVTVEIDLIQNETEFARIKFTANKEKIVDKIVEEIVKVAQKK